VTNSEAEGHWFESSSARHFIVLIRRSLGVDVASCRTKPDILMPRTNGPALDSTTAPAARFASGKDEFLHVWFAFLHVGACRI
jgi:hypothetical protein